MRRAVKITKPSEVKRWRKKLGKARQPKPKPCAKCKTLEGVGWVFEKQLHLCADCRLNDPRMR